MTQNCAAVLEICIPYMYVCTYIRTYVRTHTHIYMHTQRHTHFIFIYFLYNDSERKEIHRITFGPVVSNLLKIYTYRSHFYESS